MKFTCESCNAQYMISDEKVGPSGVKVRCKKCGNVILVRRGAPAPAEEPAAPAPAAAQAQSPSAPGLEAELGQAFDHAFGDSSASAPAPAAAPASAPANGADMGSTQLMGSEDAAKVFADKPAGPSATEWYVAIGQAQVGPLPLAEVKKKWEAGDVGPDSLVWRPGMADWAPLTTVSDLAGYLAPVPRTTPRAAEPRHELAARTATPPPTPAETTWKPMGASALAALASEEISARASPEPKPAARPTQGVKSLVDALPDGGGVDPTGALPLNIKALEATTGEKKLERLSSVARGAEKARRRSTARSVVVGVLVGGVVVAGAAVGGPGLYRKYIAPQGPVAVPRQPPAASVPLPPPPAVAATPSQAPAAGKPAEPPPPPPAVAAAPQPPAAQPAQPPPAPAEPSSAAPEKQATGGTRRTGKGSKAARAEAARKEAAQRVATAEPPPPPPPPKKKGGSLLDFESNDKALDEALGGQSGQSGRSVYVPPARQGGGGGALPDKVSPGEINAAVAARIDALRRCVSEQKSREPDASGTLKMRWMIQGDGSVSDVKCLTAQYAQGAFAQCIAGVVKGIKFPRSSTSGQEVTFPFNF